MRESTVEAYFCASVTAAGGMTRKLEWVGRPHAPDRLVALPNVGTVLAELKRPGQYVRPGQGREHTRLLQHGARVEVINTYESVDAFILKYQDMSDAALLARLASGPSLFERKVLDLINRLQEQNRQLAARAAQP